MSLFKRITNLFAPSQQTDLIQCSGSFYNFSQGQWVCLFLECELVVRKIDNYKYQIEVTRVVDQEQENEKRKQREMDGLDEEEEDEDVINYYEFPITNGLELNNELGPLSNYSISWKGTSTRFLFEFDSNENPLKDQLKRTLCQCVYESMYLCPHTNGSDNEIDNLCKEYQTITRAPLQTNVTTIKADRTSLPVQQPQQHQHQQDQPQQSLYKDLLNEQQQHQQQQQQAQDQPITTNVNIKIIGEELYKCQVSLYLETNNQFNLKDPVVSVLLNKTNANPLEYTFYILKENKAIFSQSIDSNMFPQFFNEQISFIWFSGQCRWSIKFSLVEEYEAFRNKFTIIHYESINKSKFKGKKDDIEYMANILTEDHKDEEIVFDTDDGFNAHDLEDFDNLDINETNSVSDLLSEHEDSNLLDTTNNQSSGEEEEESSEEEQPTKKQTTTTQESEEEEEESGTGSEEESEEEESSEEEEEVPIKRPVSTKKPVEPESEEEEESEEETESEEDESSEEEKVPVKPIAVARKSAAKRLSSIKKPAVVSSSDEEEEEESEEEEEEEKKKVFKVPYRKPIESESESEEEESASESTEESSDEEENYSQEKKQISKDFSKSKNSSLIVGYKDKSFVVRGSTIGVFSTDENDIKFNTAITNIKQKDGKNFSPKKMMLQQQDNTMLMLNPERKSNVYKMDLNRPDIVEEWDMNWRGQQQMTNSIVAQYKNDELTNNQLFVGYNGNNMFLVDPRESKNKVSIKFHGGSNSNTTTCAATSESGQIALGTNKGEIKMFSKTQFDSKKRSTTDQDPLGSILRARTTLPGIGDPIVGIDVTKDGKWIVATCKQYIMVLPASLKDGSSGFEDRLGARRPLPKRLILKPQDIQRMGGASAINFTPAKFNITSDANDQSSETFILTSTGSFLITWNFRKIKQNVLDVYQIKQYKEEVVAEQFKSNRDNSIVVTFPDNVILSKKK